LLADDNDVRGVNCVFDAISNTNALGIPGDGTADKKKSKEFCFVVLRQYTTKSAFRAPAWMYL